MDTHGYRFRWWYAALYVFCVYTLSCLPPSLLTQGEYCYPKATENAAAYDGGTYIGAPLSVSATGDENKEESGYNKNCSGGLFCAVVWPWLLWFLARATGEPITLFTLVLAITSIGLWLQTERLAIGGERQMRAYVGFEKGIGLSEDGKQIDLFIRNFGNTPANNLRGHLNFNVRSIGVRLPHDFQFLDDGKDAGITGSVLSLPPGAAATLQHPIPQDDMFERVTNKKIELTIYGHIDYLDAFGKQRTTTFCFETISHGDGTGVFHAYHRHNEAK